MNNLVVVTPLEHEKSYKALPHTNNLVVITPLEDEKILSKKKIEAKKNLALKKIQIFLLKLTIKNFLDPLRR